VDLILVVKWAQCHSNIGACVPVIRRVSNVADGVAVSDPNKQSQCILSPGTNRLDSSYFLHPQAVSSAPDDGGGRTASYRSCRLRCWTLDFTATLELLTPFDAIFEKLIVPHPVNNPPHFMTPNSSSPCSQQPTTYLNPEAQWIQSTPFIIINPLTPKDL
jgi:hypothetical protein